MTEALAVATIDAATLTDWLADGDELAVVDVRPRDVVGYASPLFATNLPADEVLAQLSRFIPRKAVRTVLVDGGDSAAQGLVEQLAEQGWTNLVALEGGVPAWVAQGDDLPTFDVPGKDFSLAIRDERDTPAVTATELQSLREKGADVVVIDTRTLPEFAAGHVPGAIGVPGAELLLRFADLVPDPDTHVVVSCAGLPRAIIGAQTSSTPAFRTRFRSYGKAPRPGRRPAMNSKRARLPCTDQVSQQTPQPAWQPSPRTTTSRS